MAFLFVKKNTGRLSIGLALLSALTAFAGQPRGKAVKQEVYPATEPDMLPRPKQAAAVAAPGLLAPRVVTKLPDSALAYDPVPSDQVDALSKRLQLVDALIRRHGRAYDYRTHTVRDLETTLAQLDASIAPKSQPVAPKAQMQTPSTAAAAGTPPLPTPREEDEVNGGVSTPVGD